MSGSKISLEKGTPDVVSQPKQGPGNLVLVLAAALVVALGACVWLAVSAGGSGDEESLRDRVSVLEAEKAANQKAIEAASAFVARVTTYSFEEGQHDLDALANTVRARCQRVPDPGAETANCPDHCGVPQAGPDGPQSS